jgi:hypothetical protein
MTPVVLVGSITAGFHLQPLPVDAGTHFALAAIMACVILSYIFFTLYIQAVGRPDIADRAMSISRYFTAR